jgi:hypothetical protein
VVLLLNGPTNGGKIIHRFAMTANQMRSGLSLAGIITRNGLVLLLRGMAPIARFCGSCARPILRIKKCGASNIRGWYFFKKDVIIDQVESVFLPDRINVPCSSQQKIKTKSC